MWSIIGRLRETPQASVLDLLYLITDEPSAHHIATQLSQSIRRDRLAIVVLPFLELESTAHPA